MSSNQRPDFQSPLIDTKTLALFIFQLGGILFLFGLPGEGHWFLQLFFGTFLANLSFTLWHEASHGTFSKYLWINHCFGWLASFLSVYPGYFARRREHLAHHRFQGEEGLDPVYERIQCSWYLFPFVLIKSILRPKAQTPVDFLPLSFWQKCSDQLLVLASFGVAVFCASNSVAYSYFFILFLPRFLIIWLHAYYICFIPHAMPTQVGYEKFRIVSQSPLLNFLTLGQSYHGIHHYWPNYPWHLYPKLFPYFQRETGLG